MRQSPWFGANKARRAAPFSTSIIWFFALSVISGLVLTGCSSKRSGFSGKGSPVYSRPGPIPKGGGRYKIGNPYQIAGRWYTPRENAGYDRTGTASWYGPKFHRRKTANGEWFDMNTMTAAHPTLPLPVFAKVTNLENGRVVTVRINDRGPYAHDREIDLSRLAARKLGFIRKGTARVRVQYLSKAPLQASARNFYGQAPVMMASAQRTPRAAPQYRANRRPDRRRIGSPRNIVPGANETVQPAAGAPAAAAISNPGGALYVQAASYINYDNALRAKGRLAAHGRVELTPIEIGARTFYRIRVGPLRNADTARTTLALVVGAGHGDARIIAD